MLKRYRKEFQVDWECAISELTALGISFSDDYLSALRKTIAKEFSDEKKHSPIRQADFDLYHGIESESDDFFAYIAGYTPGGAPFGITWEEMEESERRGEHVDFGPDSPNTGYDGKKKPSVEEEVDFDSEKLDEPRTIKSSVPRRP